MGAGLRVVLMCEGVASTVLLTERRREVAPPQDARTLVQVCFAACFRVFTAPLRLRCILKCWLLVPTIACLSSKRFFHVCLSHPYSPSPPALPNHV